ncbi:hypothetical protein WJX79_007358 [Trebouxia sp. C0005]
MDAKFVGACPGDEAGSLKVRATRADGDGNDRAVQEEPLTSLHAKHKQVGCTPGEAEPGRIQDGRRLTGEMLDGPGRARGNNSDLQQVDELPNAHPPAPVPLQYDHQPLREISALKRDVQQMADVHGMRMLSSKKFERESERNLKILGDAGMARCFEPPGSWIIITLDFLGVVWCLRLVWACSSEAIKAARIDPEVPDGWVTRPDTHSTPSVSDFVNLHRRVLESILDNEPDAEALYYGHQKDVASADELEQLLCSAKHSASKLALTAAQTKLRQEMAEKKKRFRSSVASDVSEMFGWFAAKHLHDDTCHVPI